MSAQEDAIERRYWATVATCLAHGIPVKEGGEMRHPDDLEADLAAAQTYGLPEGA